MFVRFNPKTIRVVAFDCVNTVFDVSNLTREQLSRYIEQVRDLEWSPLCVDPDWLNCPAHADSAEGINRISKSEDYLAVTFSNWPAWVLSDLSEGAAIYWSAIVPMETVQAYKPSPVVFNNLCDIFNVEPNEVLVVTANETAPDIKAAGELGMQAILIDRERKHGPEVPKTIIELAEMLGC